jgi:predicted SnoaL-like aldol condensation-catalyzing enzyme
MTQTNSSILSGFFDEVINQKHLDLLPKYISEKFIEHGSSYVGIGITFDANNTDKLIIQIVKPGSPADGKLKMGDEILQVTDGERTWRTYQELRYGGLWGQGVLGSSFTICVLRDNAEQEVQLVRGLVKGFEFPYQMFEPNLRTFFKEWPDVKVHLVNLIEAGDLVSYHIECQGNNVRYGRSAIWDEFGFAHVQDGKITDRWISDEPIALFRQLGYSILEPEMAKA